MADRRVRLILEAQVDRFNANIKQAKTEAEGLGGSLKKAVNAPEMQQLGRHMAAFGAASVAGLGLAAKAAIDWETSWADVMRRTDGTPQQLEALEAGLRGIATELPTTHDEIAAVAAAAAQLGIKVTDVEEFTRVMIDMGVSTNLTAEQAATSMARFANIMGTPTEEMRNLGSAVVDLGNNAATTESEIMDMAMRLAGAGTQAGLSEGEVLGMATAMSSLGIQSQAGGTALSRTMNTIGLEVDMGGDKLEAFAETAGMTSAEFSAAWRDDAAGALVEFVGGLAGAEERGESMNVILQELGITSEREADALRRLASNTDLLTDSIDRGNGAYEENAALATEAGYVYDTVASQLKAFWSNIQDAAITIGQAFLPALESMVKWLSQAVSWFAEIPGPVQSTVAWLGLLGGALVLAAGSAIILAPSLLATATALGAVGISGAAAHIALGKLGRGAVGLATAFAVIGVAVAGAKLLMSDFEFGVEDARRSMEGSKDAAVEFEGNIWGVGRGFDGMGEAMARTQDHGLIDKFSRWGAGVFGLENSLTRSKEAVDAHDQAMADMLAEGNLEGAAEGMRQLAAEAEEAGVPINTIAHNEMPMLSAALEDAGTNMDEFMSALGLQNGYVDAASGKWVEGSVSLSELRDRMSESEETALAAALGVEELDDAMGGAMGGASELDTALEEVGLSADGTIESLSAFADVLFETGLLTMSARDATARFHESIDAAEAAVRTIIESNGEMGSTLNKNKTDFDLTTEAGRLANGAFQDITQSGFDAARAMAENGASQQDVQGKLRGTYDSLVTAAQGFGLTKQEAMNLTREVLGVPEGVSIDSWMSEEAERTAESLSAELDAVDGRQTRSYHTHSITTREIKVSSGVVMNQSSGGLTFSTGGAVRGPGSGTSDDVDARLSHGEHVLTAREVAAMGGQDAVYNFRRQLGQPSASEMQPASGRDMVSAYTAGSVAQSGGGTAVAERPINITGNHFNVNSALDIRKVSEDLAKQVRRDLRG